MVQIPPFQLPVAFDVNVQAAACTSGAGSTKHMLTAKASVTTIDDHLFQFFQIILYPKRKTPILFLDVNVFLPRTSSECPKELVSVSSSVTRLSLLGTRGFASPDYSGFAFIGVSL
jgi:hypothetical protein